MPRPRPACQATYLIIEYTGEGEGLTAVDAVLHTDLFLAITGSVHAYHGQSDSGVELPVDHWFDFKFCDKSLSLYPPPELEPGVGVTTTVYEDDQIIAEGEAEMDESGTPVASGNLAGMTFEPWTAPGPEGRERIVVPELN